MLWNKSREKKNMVPLRNWGRPLLPEAFRMLTPAGNIWHWIHVSSLFSFFFPGLQITTCLGQSPLLAEIRFKKWLQTVRKWSEGACRSPGTGCLPPWQTNPPPPSGWWSVRMERQRTTRWWGPTVSPCVYRKNWLCPSRPYSTIGFLTDSSKFLFKRFHVWCMS